MAEMKLLIENWNEFLNEEPVELVTYGDLRKQLELAKNSSKIVRVFESIGSVTDVAHPHFITPETFTDVLGNFGKIYKGGSEPGFHGADCYYGTWNESDNV